LFLEADSSDVTATVDQEKKSELISGNAGGIYSWMTQRGVEV
jgi:hypothetical protein